MRPLLLVLVGLLGTAHAWAQPPVAAKPADAKPIDAKSAGPAAAAAPAISPAQAQQALDVLRDPKRRADVLNVLETLARIAPPAPGSASGPASAQAAGSAAGPAPATAPPPADAQETNLPLVLPPDSVGAQLLVGASQHIEDTTRDLIITFRTATDFPALWSFVVYLATDPWSQGRIVDIAWKLALVMGAGLGVQFIAARALARVRHRLARAAHAQARRTAAEAGAEDSIAAAEAGQTERLWHRLPLLAAALRRVPYALARLLLELAPVLLLLATGYTLLSAGPATDSVTRLVILGFLHAYAGCRAITCVSRALFGPGEPQLVPVGDIVARAILRWVRRYAAVGIFGYTIAEVGLLFGLYALAHAALLKLIVLILHGMTMVIVLRQRQTVAAWIRSNGDGRRLVDLARDRFASIWHVLAIFYLVALWVVWALDIERGFARLLELFVLTAAITGGSRVVYTTLHRWLDRISDISPEDASRYPGLRDRIATYVPVVRATIRVAVSVAALLALMEAWGFAPLGWLFAGGLGERLIASLVTIAVTLVVAVAIWELANAAIQRHLNRLAREAQLARSARLRTLLPLLRTALLITIFLVTGMLLLSEIGVNIAPLLAGAGVVGVAIGFGSQKLVQDIITGLFLLLENAMQVGDTVTLGGLSGTVENLSIRTIRLRALDGSVHIIPFSAVTTVTNMTRDFGYAVIDVQVGLNEEPDRIAELLRGIAKELRAEPRWSIAIRDDIEIFGVERFLANAWLMRARIRTTPGQRWAVGRELNRRIKYKFDALAIDSPMTAYRALDREPPAFIQLAPEETT